jgi:hypothetical protein
MMMSRRRADEGEKMMAAVAGFVQMKARRWAAAASTLQMNGVMMMVTAVSAMQMTAR